MTISKTNKFLYFFFAFTIYVGLYFGEDSSGSGGFIADFKTTLPLFKDPFQSAMFGGLDMKFPLHYYIGYVVYSLVKNDFYLRFFYSTVSLAIPYIFYLSLKEKYKLINLNFLFQLSLTIFLFPAFRSSAIWANTQITAIMFFVLALYFFSKWEVKKTININLMLLLFFMALAVYTRQEYALPYLYFVYYFYRELNLKNFIKTCLAILLLAIPGLYLVILYPTLVPVYLTIDLYDSLLVNASILSFYLIPIFFIVYFIDGELKNLNIQRAVVGALICFFVVVFCSLNFNYNFRLGGGFFLKLSALLFNNFFFFYFTSFLGFFFIYLLVLDNKKNLIISLILLFGFSSYYITQKYFEPMFFLLLFLVCETKLTKNLLMKRLNVVLLQLYFLFYLTAAISNNYLLLTKKL
jgi:hypothetical protein